MQQNNLIHPLALTALFVVMYLIAFQLQRYVVFPVESLLGWEITEKASIFYLPAGVQLLAFYFLRWWFVAFALVARTIIYYQFWETASWTDAAYQAIVVALTYPLLLRVFESNARWHVFGTEHQPDFTVTGVVIFQTLVTLLISLIVAAQGVMLGMVEQAEALQYTIHYLIGDVIGAVGVMYAFYLVFKVGLIKLR